jgi:hypothetical protein
MASLNNPRVNRLEADVAAIKSQLNSLEKRMFMKFDSVKELTDMNLTILRRDLTDLNESLSSESEHSGQMSSQSM